MIRRSLYIRRKATLKGWLKWVAVLALPFSALAFDTWLNTETLRKDYETAEVNKRMKDLSATLDGLRLKQVGLETYDRIEIEAPDLGLVEPQPGQVQVIYYAEESDAPVPEPESYVLARHQKETVRPDRSKSMSGRTSLSSNEVKSWDTYPHSSLMSATTMEDLLRKAVYAVSAPSPGDS
jgi:hypothetical protein